MPLDVALVHRCQRLRAGVHHEEFPPLLSSEYGTCKPPWRQPRGKFMVSVANSHTHATRIGWHLWEIDLRFAPGLPLGWIFKASFGPTLVHRCQRLCAGVLAVRTSYPHALVSAYTSKQYPHKRPNRESAYTTKQHHVPRACGGRSRGADTLVHHEELTPLLSSEYGTCKIVTASFGPVHPAGVLAVTRCGRICGSNPRIRIHFQEVSAYMTQPRICIHSGFLNDSL